MTSCANCVTLAAQLVPMIFATGLGTTYSEGDSKAARTRNNLLVKVIRGATVLKLRDEIDTYPACSPEDMVRLDRSIVAVSFGAEKILTKRFFSDRMKLRPSLSAD